MRIHSAPFAIVVKKGILEPYKLKTAWETDHELTREAALRMVTACLEKDAIVVSTTGKISRELFEHREAEGQEHDTDFLTVGSMGHSSSIALGLALGKPERPVYIFDGDGATIMHMGALAVIAQQATKNLRHLVFNNGAHDSVGGQPTAGLGIDLPAIALANGYKASWRATTEKELAESLGKLQACEGPNLLEIQLRKGAHADLGRPTRTPRENKKALMASLVIDMR